MGLFDKLVKKDSSDLGGVSISREDHVSMITQRSKQLIEELVSPLSEPNQRVIDEVLQIIAQSSTLPDNLINKEEVQRTTKQLLFQLIEPIPNPNKQLIDELLQLVTHSGSFKEVPKIYANETTNKLQNTDTAQQGKTKQEIESEKSIKQTEERVMGKIGLSQQKQDAIAQAPFPSQLQRDPLVDKRMKETKSVMNLILEQIKELITITNSLNTKIKNHQVRIESFEGSLEEVKGKSKEYDERMVAFEKNMEKFIGLYEVVTNQYNPFVETADVSHPDGQPSMTQQESPQMPEPIKVEEKITFEIDGTEVKDLDQLSDSLLSISESDFKEKILTKKEKLFKWLNEIVKNETLVKELEGLETKSDYIKSVFKAIHS